MNANQQKPRRWFRFSLRTMFMLVTVLCVWLGGQIHIVRTREAMLSELKANGAKIIDVIDTTLMQPGWGMEVVRSRDSRKKPSWVRKSLGDSSIPMIYLEHADQENMRRSSYFPEAEVLVKCKFPLKSKSSTKPTSSEFDLFEE